MQHARMHVRWQNAAPLFIARDVQSRHAQRRHARVTSPARCLFACPRFRRRAYPTCPACVASSRFLCTVPRLCVWCVRGGGWRCETECAGYGCALGCRACMCAEHVAKKGIHVHARVHGACVRADGFGRLLRDASWSSGVCVILKPVWNAERGWMCFGELEAGKGEERDAESVWDCASCDSDSPPRLFSPKIERCVPRHAR